MSYALITNGYHGNQWYVAEINHDQGAREGVAQVKTRSRMTDNFEVR